MGDIDNALIGLIGRACNSERLRRRVGISTARGARGNPVSSSIVLLGFTGTCK